MSKDSTLDKDPAQDPEIEPRAIWFDKTKIPDQMVEEDEDDLIDWLEDYDPVDRWRAGTPPMPFSKKEKYQTKRYLWQTGYGPLMRELRFYEKKLELSKSDTEKQTIQKNIDNVNEQLKFTDEVIKFCNDEISKIDHPVSTLTFEEECQERIEAYERRHQRHIERLFGPQTQTQTQTQTPKEQTRNPDPLGAAIERLLGVPEEEIYMPTKKSKIEDFVIIDLRE